TEQIESASALHVAFIKKRIIEAANIESADPERSIEIYDGVIQLYREKPWATDYVEQAAVAIERLRAR
ncbi:MAG: hypothetical protein KDB27_32190, partial [Planctomycetales bacterium]|nr:hypothetical protein [Planctomycetales bacterium]